MPRLTKAQKLFLVRAFAEFETPTSAAALVNEQFGIEITRQSAQRYDPTTTAGADLAAYLTEEFRAHRQRFLGEMDQIALSHKPYRMRELQRAYDRLKLVGNVLGGARIIEQAAREMEGIKIDVRGEVRTRRTTAKEAKELAAFLDYVRDDPQRQSLTLNDWRQMKDRGQLDDG